MLKNLAGSIFGRLTNLLPVPIFLGLVAIAIVFGGLWVLEYQPEKVPLEILLNPWFIAWVIFVILAVIAYYMVAYFRNRPNRTTSGYVGMWLAKLEGDIGDEYLRDLKGQIEQELSPDPSLRNVEISVYSHVLRSHDEARDVGIEVNAKAVVWGNVGKGLDERRVSNLKLTIVGGPMNLQTDVQFRSELNLVGYEMRDVVRFVAGYDLLSKGRPTEATIHFDRILSGSRPNLFELSDALQFGGIAYFLSTRESAETGPLLEKAERYFTQYVELWSEEHEPRARATGLFNLGSVYGVRSNHQYMENINKALKFYGEAAALYSEGNDAEGVAMAKMHMAHIYSELYQAQNQATYGTVAYITLEEVNGIITRVSNPYLYGKLQFMRGQLLVRMGYGLSGIPIYFRDAVAAFEEAIEVFQSSGYPFESVMTTLHWGGARVNMEDANDQTRREVLEAYRAALSVATKEKFPSTYAKIQSSICAVLLDLPPSLPNLQAALRAGEEALDTQTPGEDGAEYARACNNYASACLAYSSLEEMPEDESMHCLKKGLRSAESASEMVSPSFYPNYYKRASELIREAKEKLDHVE